MPGFLAALFLSSLLALLSYWFGYVNGAANERLAAATTVPLKKAGPAITFGSWVGNGPDSEPEMEFGDPVLESAKRDSPRPR